MRMIDPVPMNIKLLAISVSKRFLKVTGVPQGIR